jgi:hypothetical protein
VPTTVPAPAGASAERAGAPRPGQRWRGAVAAAVVTAVTVLQLPALLSPFAGGFHDDGVYLVTARALAEGRGYVIESLPQELAQNKYPVLFPAALAVVWKAFPAFPDNLPLLRLVPLLAMWLWLWLLWKVVARELGWREEARWIVALMLASPMTLYFGTQLLSETLFAALGTWAVLLMVRMGRGTAAGGVRAALLLAVACALAFHTRTMGIALLAPAAWVLVRRRDLAAAAVFAGTWAAACAPWILWQALHAAPADPVLAYYTKANYGGWNLLTGGEQAELWTVAATNAVHLMAMPHLVWGLPRFVLAHWLGLAVLAAAAAGGVRLLRGPAAAGAVWAAATAAVVLLWPWPPTRFIVPVLPFIILGVLRLARTVPSTTAWPAVRGMLAVLLVSGAATSAAIAWDSWRNDARASYTREGGSARQEMLQAAAWVRTHTPPDAVIAANLDPGYWLYAGRKAVRAFAADPIRLFYTRDAPAAALGDAAALRELLIAHQVTHLVWENVPIFGQTRPFHRQIEELREAWPGVLAEAWRSGGSGVVVYSVDW